MTIFGTEGDDRLVGSALDDTLYGGLGRDILDGRDGNDVLSAGGSASGKPEYLRGRDGDDTYLITENDTWAYILEETSGTDKIVFADHLNGAFEGVYVDTNGYLNITFVNGSGSLARVTVRDYLNIERFEFSDGSFVTRFEDIEIGGRIESKTVNGSDSADSLTGSSANEIMFGGVGDDRLRGERGDDSLFGGDGRDNLDGGAGNDVLSAGGNRDNAKPEYLRGRDGDDTYLITDQDVRPYILNETETGGSDRIVFEDHRATDLTEISIDKSGYLNLSFVNAYSETALLTVRDYQNIESFVFADGAVFDANTILTAKDRPSMDEMPVMSVAGDYKLRTSEPVHDGYKYQDSDGNWYSPDYFVIVAAGQSNMLGAGSGGTAFLDPNVVAYDWVNKELVPADYAAAPAGGEGVRTGTSFKNNLFFPFANRVAEELDRPVMVIARPVSGSSIDTWLTSSDGTNWNNLATDVDAALAAIGQDSVDAFLWHQGESDASVDPAVFASKFQALVDQVNAQSWGDEAAFLAGELSYQGDNNTQNLTLQEIELSETDPDLAFVSSVGLTSQDESGVHFDGASLVEFGFERFWNAFQSVLNDRNGVPAAPNSKPVIQTSVALPTELVLQEGDVYTWDVSQFFTDADGDELFYYSSLSKRGLFLTKGDGTEIVLTPGYGDAGVYTLDLYATDYTAMSDRISVTLSITPSTPGVQAFSNSSFTSLLDSYRDFDVAQSALKANRGIEVLDQSALDPAGTRVSLDTLHIKGAAGLTGQFVQDNGANRISLYGEADFDVTGNSDANFQYLNDGDNLAQGLDGDDHIYGGAGADILFGGSGLDRLYGGTGDDVLYGGGDKDQLFGNEGADTFVISSEDDTVLLRDFSVADGDLIQFEGFADLNSFEDLKGAASFRFVESNGTGDLRLGDARVIIYNANDTELNVDWFDFG